MLVAHGVNVGRMGEMWPAWLCSLLWLPDSVGPLISMLLARRIRWTIVFLKVAAACSGPAEHGAWELWRPHRTRVQ